MWDDFSRSQMFTEKRLRTMLKNKAQVDLQSLFTNPALLAWGYFFGSRY